LLDPGAMEFIAVFLYRKLVCINRGQRVYISRTQKKQRLIFWNQFAAHCIENANSISAEFPINLSHSVLPPLLAEWIGGLILSLYPAH
jgi:hypothetical protein